jgi:transposase InsO family protein
VDHVVAEYGVYGRLAWRVLGQHRSTQRKKLSRPDGGATLTPDITALAIQFGRYGYRRITTILRNRGWRVNAKRVARIWPREGLKVTAKQPKRGRLGLNDRSYIRQRADWPSHVWFYDFVQDRTYNGKKYRMVYVIDEFTHRLVAIRIERRLRSTDVIDMLCNLFILRGVPEYIHSDNGPKFIMKALRDLRTTRLSNTQLGIPRSNS